MNLTAILAGLLALTITGSIAAYQYFDKQQTIAQNTITTLTKDNTELKDQVDFANRSLEIKDSTMLQFLTANAALVGQLNTTTQIIYSYKPEVETDESKCLDLLPPADLINRVRENRSGN